MNRNEGPRSLGDKRLQIENKKRRDRIEIAPDGDGLLFPEKESTLTLEQAVVEAQGIVAKYADEKVLINDCTDHDLRSGAQSGPGQTSTDGDPKIRMHTLLTSQRETVAASSTEQLRKILELHVEYPQHYNPTVVMAAAEELLSRLQSE